MKTIVIMLAAMAVLASCNPQNPEKMTSENTVLVNQYFEHFNQHDWDKMAALYSETAEFKDPSLGQGIVKQSREQVAQKYRELSEVFPDLSDSVVQVYPSGEKHVIVEFVSSGTAPDGSKFELPICTIFTIEDGQITKDYTYYDNFEE